MDRSEAHRVMTEVFGDDVHAKRVKSLGDGALGVLEAGAVGIHAIGQGLAAACNLAEKHAIKQVDRLIGNKGVSVDALSPAWVEHVLGDREEVVANFDWTEFDADDQSMIVLAAQTGHGRAMPLLWKSVVKSELAGKRNDTEDAVLERFRELVPRSVKVTVVADRGFGDTALYDHLDRMGFFYVIRFRSNIIVEHDGVRQTAKEWMVGRSRPLLLRGAKVTARGYVVPSVLLVQDPGMKDGWCLVSNLPDATAADLKRLYGKRFSIEETFRDIKDLRYGFGLSWTRIKTPERRDRLFLLAVLALALLTLLGQAGENLGMDRMLKANTVKRRTLSLVRQGLRWYEHTRKMSEDKLLPLMTEFQRLVEMSLLSGHIRAISQVVSANVK